MALARHDAEPFGRNVSCEAFMAHVNLSLDLSTKYGFWIQPPNDDKWYTPEEFRTKFSDWYPEYFLFFHACKHRKPPEIFGEMMKEYKEEILEQRELCLKVAQYYQAF